MYAFIGLKLRACVSLFNCFEITNEQIQELARKSLEYFRANALFLSTSVNPTVWTLGNIVPTHCKEVFQRYGQGLCTVTMEGREAKHVFLKRLSEKSSFQRQWYDILSMNLLFQSGCQRKGLTHFCTNQARMFTSQVKFLTMGTIVIAVLKRQTQQMKVVTFVLTSYIKIFKTVFWQEKFLLHQLRSFKVPSNTDGVGNFILFEQQAKDTLVSLGVQQFQQE